MANLRSTVYRNVNVHNSGKFYYNDKRINMYVLAFLPDPFEDLWNTVFLGSNAVK